MSLFLQSLVEGWCRNKSILLLNITTEWNPKGQWSHFLQSFEVKKTKVFVLRNLEQHDILKNKQRKNWKLLELCKVWCWRREWNLPSSQQNKGPRTVLLKQECDCSSIMWNCEYQLRNQSQKKKGGVTKCSLKSSSQERIN